jgi:phytoene desaturase
MKKVAVIGSGIGGLTCAAILASKGYHVDLYEQNSMPGGKAGSSVIKTEVGNFRFDTGPSLMTMDFIFKDIFNQCNENLNEYLEYQPLEILCKYFWSDQTNVSWFCDISKLKPELNNKYLLTTEKDNKKLDQYLTYRKRIFDKSKDFFLFNPITVRSYFRPKFLFDMLTFWQLDSLSSMAKTNKRFFSSGKLQQIFNRYATYNGSNPYLAPATLNSIGHVESMGGFLPKNGIYDIIISFYKLCCKKGVTFYFNHRVESINIDSNNTFEINYHTNAITELKTSQKYDKIVSNIDPLLTYNLFTDLKILTTKTYSRLLKRKLSTSCLVFFWGIKGIYPDLELHNILFSDSYYDEFKQLDQNQIHDDPTIYIHITKKLIDTDAPSGYENWFVMINVPSQNLNSFDHFNQLNKIRQNIINRIEKQLKINNFRQNIIVEKLLTPTDIASHTGAYQGSLYGQNSNNLSSAFKRTGSRSKIIKNLYFCGGSCHPGGGMPLVSLSGKFAALAIIQDSHSS